MIKLIKWLSILSFFAGMWFLYSFMTNLSDDAKIATRNEAILALDEKDAALFTAPLTGRLKEEFTAKKEGAFSLLRQKVRAWLVGVFGEGESREL
jgi:hypothetical protein